MTGRGRPVSAFVRFRHYRGFTVAYWFPFALEQDE